MMTSTDIKVVGMDCQSCVLAIETGLKQLEGVQAVNVDWKTGLTRVTHEDDRVGKDILERRIEELGFQVARDGESEVAAARRAPVAPQVLVAAFIALVPLLYAFRNSLVYTPGENAAFVPGGLDIERFSAVSAIAVGVAFAAGVAVFFSPAILAMVSVVLGYTAGTAERGRGEALKVAAGFAAGLTLVDAAVGAAFGGIGKGAILFVTGHLATWNLLLAVVLVGVGLLMLRVWHLHMPGGGLRPRQVQGFRGAFLLSVPFGLIDCPGCTPLLFPIAIGVAIVGDPLFGAAVMGAYGLGRGALLMAVGASAGLLKQTRGVSRLLPIMEIAGGWLLLIAGLYFFKEFLRLAEVAGL